jgi:hypothetical protein
LATQWIPAGGWPYMGVINLEKLPHWFAGNHERYKIGNFGPYSCDNRKSDHSAHRHSELIDSSTLLLCTSCFIWSQHLYGFWKCLNSHAGLSTLLLQIMSQAASYGIVMKSPSRTVWRVQTDFTVGPKWIPFERCILCVQMLQEAGARLCSYLPHEDLHNIQLHYIQHWSRMKRKEIFHYLVDRNPTCPEMIAMPISSCSPADHKSDLRHRFERSLTGPVKP